MATTLPWYFDFQHCPASATGATMALGEGGLAGIDNAGAGPAQVASSTSMGPETRRVLQIPRGGSFTVAVPAGVEFAVGFRHNINAGYETGLVLLDFLVGASAKLDLYMNSDRTISVRRGTTVLGTSTAAAPTDAGCYIEIAVLLDGSVGTWELAMDGVVEASDTGGDANTSNVAGDVTSIKFRNTNGLAPNWIEFADLYIRDVAERHGVVNGIWQDPTADVQAEFTPDSGGDNYARVADASGCDGDTSYLESSTLAQRDIFTMEALPEGSNSVIAIVNIAVSRAPEGGAPLIALGNKRDASEVLNPGQAVGTSAYRTQSAVFTTQPNGAALSAAAVDDIDLILEAA